MNKAERRRKIRYRVRKNVRGTAARPRLSVYRSNKAIYCQLIDDVNGTTIAQASTADEGMTMEGTKIDQAKRVGTAIGELAKSHNIETVVFDRGGYLYHGRVKALADGAREQGLKF